MGNLMKDTRCRICNADMNNWTYDKMIAHANMHAISKPGQKSFEDFTK